MGTNPRRGGRAFWKALQKRFRSESLGILCTYRNVALIRGCGRSLLNGEGAVSRPAAHGCNPARPSHLLAGECPLYARAIVILFLPRLGAGTAILLLGSSCVSSRN